MEFETFADRLSAIEAEPGDLETIQKVAALFEASDAELSTVVRFVQGRVFPAWSSTTHDIGPSLCYTAIARAAGQNVSTDDVESQLADQGEIGAVAERYDFGGQQGLAAFGSGGPTGLTVADVDTELRLLAEATGSGSQDRKVDLLFGLFRRCSPLEARYLARLVLGEMRIGVGEGSVRDAIAEAFDLPVEAVSRGLQVTNDYGEVAAVARRTGQAGLDGLALEIGRPVQAMLAQAGTAADALDDWDEAAAEIKFDGARVQIHVGEGVDSDSDGVDSDSSTKSDRNPERPVSIYSRNMDDVTEALPDIVDFVNRTVTEPCIIDGEVVAVDEHGGPLPFQHVLRRFRRKHDIERIREEIRLHLHAFDCLRVGQKDLLSTPLVDRHRQLETVFGEHDAVAELLLSGDPDELSAFEADALEAGHEGIMLKDPQSTYSPGNRGKHWLKRKPDVETVDLVVTGAEWGEGRRASFLGTFLLSVYDPDTDGYRTIGKVATGITDEQLADLSELLNPEILSESGQTVDIRPSVVFEVGYEEIQPSPTYSSGYGLRFPRFVAVRTEKSPQDAETIDRIERLAEQQ
jgi:DNA ligase-1